MRAIAEQLRTSFQIKAAGIDIGIRALSGGNQQKVAIAAAVGSKPHVLALEEPTRGVDISSKAEIYEILRRFAADGGAVLLFCTEIPEVYEVADRLHVVSDGRLSAPLDVRRVRGHGGAREGRRQPRDARLRRDSSRRLSRGPPRAGHRDRPGRRAGRRGRGHLSHETVYSGT